MKFAVFGAGGVGSFYGGMLAKAGYEVVFIGRGKHLEAMKSKGLLIKSYKFGNWLVKEDGNRVVFTDNYKVADKVDVVLVTVKSYDTKNVAPKVAEILKDYGVAISIQNGIENEEILGEFLGEDRVLGATAFIGTYVESPGVVVHEAAGLLEIGELSGEITERVKELASLLGDAGIEVRVSKNIKYTLWKKLVWNVAFNPYSVVTGATVGEMLSMPETRDVLRNLMVECYKVAKEEGINLKSSVIEKYLSSSPDLMNYKTSMLLDFERGKPLEIDGITGALIRRAEKHGLEVPYNRCIYATVKLLEKKRDEG